MDLQKSGESIRLARKKLQLTQQALAEHLGVSAQAVSKWERGAGFPDPALLPKLCACLALDPAALLRGDTAEKPPEGGNMKKTQFYVCPRCGNILTAASDAGVSCCGLALTPLTPRKAAAEERLTVELIENEYCLTSSHSMTKENYIVFAALLTGDSLLLRRFWPEWDFVTRFPRLAHGKLLWYSAAEGLLYQLL